jgi:hypothetical protein
LVLWLQRQLAMVPVLLLDPRMCQPMLTATLAQAASAPHLLSATSRGVSTRAAASAAAARAALVDSSILSGIWGMF